MKLDGAQGGHRPEPRRTAGQECKCMAIPHKCTPWTYELWEDVHLAGGGVSWMMTRRLGLSDDTGVQGGNVANKGSWTTHGCGCRDTIRSSSERRFSPTP